MTANIVENFTLSQIHSKQLEKNIISCFSCIGIKLSTTFKNLSIAPQMDVN